MFTGNFAIVLQLAAGAFIVWGLFHEDKLIRLEDRIAAAFRRMKQRRRETPVRPMVRAKAQLPKEAVQVRPARGSRCA
ncbi:MAG: hypothetical protein HFE86_04685 [Clostridiales bacterium]|nr:hypothetical protein [Clostridiales bacterium]